MIKQTPSLGRIIAMVAFTMSVFAILIFLWLAFGGSVPLQPEGYRFTVHMGEAATLATEADVRMAGVNVGKVKTKELDTGGARTIVAQVTNNGLITTPAAMTLARADAAHVNAGTIDITSANLTVTQTGVGAPQGRGRRSGGLADPALAGEEEDPHPAEDSTRAFSSRSAVCMIRPWVRRLMKPGMGTMRSASSW